MNPTLPTRVICGRPRDAAEKLFLDNLPLIGTVMQRFHGLSADEREEAEALARLGLLHAARKFDPARGFAFSTFATASIWGFMMRARRESARQHRLPCVSLNAPWGRGEEGDGDEQGDFLRDPTDAYAVLLDAESFETRIARLPPRERRLVRAVFADGETFAEAAAPEGLTRQRAAQLVKSAVRRLRQNAAYSPL